MATVVRGRGQMRRVVRHGCPRGMRRAILVGMPLVKMRSGRVGQFRHGHGIGKEEVARLMARERKRGSDPVIRSERQGVDATQPARDGQCRFCQGH